MKVSPEDGLRKAVTAYVAAPTADNRMALLSAVDAYHEQWIVGRATPQGDRKRDVSGGPPNTYNRKLEVTRVIDGIPTTLAMQHRTSVRAAESWWTVSWRSKYGANAPNRRFYMTTDGCWTIPARVALEMIDELGAMGGLDESYLDYRGSKDLNPEISTAMIPTARSEAFAKVVGPDEDWGHDPFFVICADPSEHWQKVLIVNTSTDVATFRSITTDPNYKQKKTLRPAEGWWLDNSMMDANVQQTRAFSSALRNYLDRRPTQKRRK